MQQLRLLNAGFRYPGAQQWIFRGVNLELESGDTVRITGRNGAGKSTLLKVLASLLSPSEGEIDLASGCTVVYMDQFAGEMLALDLTIREQLEIAQPKHQKEMQQQLELLDSFGLGLRHRLEDFVGHLSGGERQVVALLSVLATGASVLCLDEFTAALDRTSLGIVNALLASVAAKGQVTCVFVSHGDIEIPVSREVSLARQA